MKVKNLLVATAILASTITITHSGSAIAQDLTSKEEVWADYNYDDIKDLPSKVNIELTNSDGFSTQDISGVAFGTGLTYLNRDGLEWFGTHATSITDGKLIMYFSVIGELLKKPKGSSSLIILDQDSDTIYGEDEGMAIVDTRGNTGLVGDTMIAKSHHEVHLGWSTSDTDTIEEVVLK